MSLFARSDLMSVAVPTSSGGCGATHSRPVTHGAPAKTWKLDCPPCEQYLRGDRKPKILKHKIENGRVVAQERVADADPMWSSTPDAVPLTPDEERVNAVREVRGTQQIQMIQALAALRATGMNVPDDAEWVMEQYLPTAVLKGTVLCANQHDNPAGLKFCGECGVSMAAKATLGPAAVGPATVGAGDEEPVPVDLSRLHVATLRKMCRNHTPPLPDKGSKDQLIARLAA